MNTFPLVALLSEDEVLADLLRQLLTRERFIFQASASAEGIYALCQRDEGRPAVVLVDTIEAAHEARVLLRSYVPRLTAESPAVLLLTGSTTPVDVSLDPLVDATLAVPLCSDALIDLVGHHARARVNRASEPVAREVIPFREIA